MGRAEAKPEIESGMKPFTPETLAERWSCSARMVRKMLAKGSLLGFKIGTQWRISAHEVDRYECASAGIEVPSSSSGTKTDADSAAHLARIREMLPRRGSQPSGPSCNGQRLDQSVQSLRDTMTARLEGDVLAMPGSASRRSTGT